MLELGPDNVGPATSENSQDNGRQKRRVFLGLLVASAFVLACKPEQEKTLKETVLAFSWKDAEKEGKIRDLAQVLAQSYLKFTQSSRIDMDNLVNPDNLNLYFDRKSFLQGIRAVEPSYEDRPTTRYGYAHYASRKVFIDVNSLTSQNIRLTPVAGLPFIHILWHEWGHLDVVDRTTGELINNPQKAAFISPNSGQNEPYLRYRGAEVFTQTYYGFVRFNEVVLDTIAIRRLEEQVKLDDIVYYGEYYPNGLDFFVKYTQAVGISLRELYTLYATSDFEGLLKRIGDKLPGSNSALAKGGQLAVGIHQSDANLIKKTGALNLIPLGK